MILFLAVFSACKDTQSEQQPTSSVSLATFLQTVNLPENLTITFDPSKVQSVASAKTYTANFLELNADTVAKQLLRKEIISKKSMAEGPWFQTGDDSYAEYLTVLDGGKSFGTEIGVNGGLYYGAFIDEKQASNYSTVISGDVGPPSINEQLHSSLLRSDYASRADLSFSNYADALAAIEQQLNAIGIPRLEVAETYSLDLNTLEKHYAAYLETTQDKEELIEWSKNDEAYLFHFL